MILVVNIAQRPATTVVIDANTPGVELVVIGGLYRCDVDMALIEARAGVAPGHHAEISVAWLTEHVDELERSEWLAHLKAGAIDESENWLAVPIIWGSSGRPKSASPSCTAQQAAHRTAGR
jgi:hypothetical protein